MNSNFFQLKSCAQALDSFVKLLEMSFVSVSSCGWSQLQELTDAVLYLVNYSYSCAERTVPRASSRLQLYEMCSPPSKAKDFPSRSELESTVADDLKALQGMQNDDGGFGFWKRGEQSWPYLSLHVAHALRVLQTKRLRGSGRNV